MIGRKFLAGWLPSSLWIQRSNAIAAQLEKFRESTANHSLKKIRKRAQSLRFSMHIYISVAVAVLVVNICWIVWAKVKYQTISTDGGLGSAIIFQGDCDKANYIDTCLHLLINILSTLVLTGSNFFLSVYSSPSRQEVEKAHRRGSWVRIGVYSLGNIFHISYLKSFVCALLVTTSVPFSLLYNSMIFTSTTGTEYRWAVVNPEFLSNASSVSGQNVPAGYLDMRQQASSYERLGNIECIQAYRAQMLTARRNLLLVSNETSDSGSILRYGYASFCQGGNLCDGPINPRVWACLQNGNISECRPNRLVKDHATAYLKNETKAAEYCKQHAVNMTICLDHWKHFKEGEKKYGFHMAYCLSEPVEPFCSVRFSWNIMTAVLICNCVKIFTLLLVLSRFDVEQPLITIGDAVSSFLAIGDPYTLEMRLMNKTPKPPWISWRSHNTFSSYQAAVLGFSWPWNMSFTSRRGKAVSRQQWFLFVLVMIVVIMLNAMAFYVALQKLNGESVSPSDVKFGKPDLQALLFPFVQTSERQGSKDLLRVTLVANAAQLILSCIYIIYQTLLTTIFLAQEWDEFSLKDKAIVASTPLGDQKGAWFFGIPLIPGIFVQIFQTTYHWVVSQAIFPLRVELLSDKGKPLAVEASANNQAVYNCGFSVQAIAIGLPLAIILLITPFLFGMRKLRGGDYHPIVGTCSLLISAACQNRVGTDDAKSMVRKKLRWVKTKDLGDGISYGGFVSAEEWHETRSLDVTEEKADENRKKLDD